MINNLRIMMTRKLRRLRRAAAGLRRPGLEHVQHPRLPFPAGPGGRALISGLCALVATGALLVSLTAPSSVRAEEADGVASSSVKRESAASAPVSPEGQEPSIDLSRYVGDFPQDAQTRALVRRVEERWAAQIARDFAAVYGYELPSYREKTPIETYRRRFGAAVDWHAVAVADVNHGADGEAEVAVVVDHSFTSPLDDGAVVRDQTRLLETWVREDGVWYHRIDLRDPFGSLESGPREEAPGTTAEDQSSEPGVSENSEGKPEP